MLVTTKLRLGKQAQPRRVILTVSRQSIQAVFWAQRGNAVWIDDHVTSFQRRSSVALVNIGDITFDHPRRN